MATQNCEDCGELILTFKHCNSTFIQQCDCDIEETHRDDFECGVRILGITPIPSNFHDKHIYCPYATNRN